MNIMIQTKSNICRALIFYVVNISISIEIYNMIPVVKNAKSIPDGLLRFTFFLFNDILNKIVPITQQIMPTIIDSII